MTESIAGTSEEHVEAPAENGMVDINRCRRLVDLVRKKAALEEELKTTTAEIEALWSPILQDITRCGLKNVSLKTGERLQPKRDLCISKASGIDSEQLCEALREEGLEWLITESYQPMRLKSWAKGLEEQMLAEGGYPDTPNDILPEALRKFLRIHERFSIVVVGAKGSTATSKTEEEQ